MRSFDPAKYRPELEGKAELKGSGQAPRKKARRPAKPVAGWHPGGTCTLSLSEGALVVTSDGGDPHLSFTLPNAVSDKPLVLTFTMTSTSRGKGQFFWQEKGVAPAFFRDRSKPFDVQHDGEAHKYSMEWSAENPVLAVRIDPSTAAGHIHISNMTLSTGDGRVVHQWKF